ncbi:unnamed protein product [Leptosia nina]|uniref:Uncharacterized protein n=1 Tax=Leptosia nina TaxID=320188 RepID=A0AAV1J1N2_9NEOP
MFNKHVKLTDPALFNPINRNVVYPSVSVNPAELREVSTNVEIVELNSFEDYEEEKDADKFKIGHQWSYIGEDLYPDEDGYKTNKKAREKRRFNKDGAINRTATYERSDHIYPTFYTLDKDYSNKHDYKEYPNRQVNCFTIPNNLRTPSTSSDDQEDIEIIQCGDTIPKHDYWNDSQESYDEVYFSRNLDTDKRTIWIYSFKNKRILAENDFLLTNIPSKNSSTSSTDDLEFEPTKESNSGRIATPIPYIPRLNLNLTSTLPTVTEVLEPTKRPSSAAEVNNANDNVSAHTTPSNTPKCDLNRWTFLSSRIKIRKTKINELPTSDRDHTYFEPEIKIINNRHNNDLNNTIEVVQHLNENSTRPNDDTVNEDGDPLQRPHIKISPQPIIKGIKISDPIEKLEGNWIGENRNDKLEPIVYDCDLISQNEVKITPITRDKDEGATNFFIRNMPLLKPAEWNEYMAITDSMPSIELSIITVDAKKSWLKRILNCVKCFRRDK